MNSVDHFSPSPRNQLAHPPFYLSQGPFDYLRMAHPPSYPPSICDMKTKSTLLGAVLLAIFLQTAHAQGLTQLPLDQPMSILEGKAFLDLPARAVNITQVPDVQSPLYHEHGHTVIRLI